MTRVSRIEELIRRRIVWVTLRPVARAQPRGSKSSCSTHDRRIIRSMITREAFEFTNDTRTEGLIITHVSSPSRDAPDHCEHCLVVGFDSANRCGRDPA